MARYTPEERAERHRALMRRRYQAGVQAIQLAAVREMVRKVQGMPYKQAVDFVQEHYRVREVKGE